MLLTRTGKIGFINKQMQGLLIFSDQYVMRFTVTADYADIAEAKSIKVTTQNPISRIFHSNPP